ncbi:dimethylsulfonioproprionate lyase family protein [Vulcaniibacterium tengchongense]|uniref:ChrR-like protein with cupin domain n=1 Tax=Vulcaniibacterium tengchongense TaxID=1273429 RepID=A0A3N4VC56_9GAMM|nr:dimethylsulfonioproprionate lyase family protein [Vulcaniibacterium tengchongense]RPE77209.1 ChrR-like protein with cupin domain [Vulcaniibacterium tengchongense]
MKPDCRQGDVGKAEANPFHRLAGGPADESPVPLRALRLDDAAGFAIGPGCVRRDLPSNPGVRVWVVEMAPGAQWPDHDHHDTGESYYVIEGEVIEGEARYGAGTYVNFAPDSRHRPRTETGVRLLGLNVGTAAFLASGGSPDSIAHCYHPTQG